MKEKTFKLGLEVFFAKDLYKNYKKAKIALLTHQAALDRTFRLSFELFYRVFGERLTFIFSPQHGLFSEKQANMIGSPDEREPFWGIPVISLYGPRLRPDPDRLKEIDVIFVDLQDVGCRVYTYIWTLFLLLESTFYAGREVVILDRPNPLASIVEGPVLEEEYYSFVGLDCLPQRHGLTLGELALLFQRRHFSTLDLKVISMEGYPRNSLFPALERPWIFPSPNLPTFESALVYPGLVFFEGTNLSEGRGTTLPFLIFGAPYLKIKMLRDFLEEVFPETNWGVKLRPIAFEPTFDKWKGMRCYGFQIHLTDYLKFRPVEFALRLLKLIKDTHPDFEFLDIPYEFEERLSPIEILIGNKRVLQWLKGNPENPIETLLKARVDHFLKEVKTIQLYKD
ncbi:hypothetical protein THC_0959 [Caldimicrobium thiodismutans]|uniref:DUF1343 domain-containing protein n=1 Tax=Caldimicrobium thiodismutans TaxID=1653476 RepID=A0A0U5AY07_9BACT|nr:DUF1343 domain-containing protein [Caldimicrobium thiodismutans]BAU23343.1 hypothetical protein THC_0959 [Caldimicrobium thiodismutans]